MAVTETVIGSMNSCGWTEWVRGAVRCDDSDVEGRWVVRESVKRCQYVAAASMHAMCVVAPRPPSVDYMFWVHPEMRGVDSCRQHPLTAQAAVRSHHPHGCTGWCEGEGKQDGSACERCVLLCIVVVSVLLAFVFRADAVLQRRTARGGSGDDGVRGALTDSRSHTRPSLVVLSLHCTRCSASVLSPSSSAAIPFNLPSASAALPFYREAAQPPLSFPAPLPSCLGASSPHPPPLPPSPPPRPLSL